MKQIKGQVHIQSHVCSSKTAKQKALLKTELIRQNAGGCRIHIHFLKNTANSEERLYLTISTCTTVKLRFHASGHLPLNLDHPILLVRGLFLCQIFPSVYPDASSTCLTADPS